MRTIANAGALKDVQERIAEASRPDGEPYDVSIGMYIGQDDYTSRFEDAEWGQTDAPITLDATLRATLPRRLEHAPVRIVSQIDDVLIDGMRGAKTTVVASEDPYTTDILASSTGSLLYADDAIKLEDFTEFENERPESIVRDIAGRLPYDQSSVVIQPIPGVRLTFKAAAENPGFSAREKTGDVLSRLAEDQTIGYRYRDTPQNGFVAWVPDPLGRSSTHFYLRRYTHTALPDWHKNRPAPPGLRYSGIRIYAIDVRGRESYQQTIQIPYEDHSRAPRPYRGQYLDIAFEDISAEAEYHALLRAEKLALALARNLSLGEMVLPTYDPLVHIDAPFQVSERKQDEDGTWELLWGMRVETYKHLYGAHSVEEAGALATQVGYTATLLQEEKLAVPRLIFPKIPDGIVKTDPVPQRPFTVAGTDVFFIDTATFIATEGDDLIFYADPAVEVSGDDIILKR